jgi:putative salt-induced outer membrane protein
LDAKTQRQISERVYLYGLGEYEDDRFSGFDYQITEGAGLGYKVFDTPVFKLNLEGGPSVQHSKVSATQDLENELLARLAVELEWNVSDSVSFTNETSMLLSSDRVEIVTDGDAGIGNEQTVGNLSALDIKIISNLSARLSYEVRYRSNPPVGTSTTTSLAKFMMVQSF